MIDKTKTYRTRGGHEARIYATDAGGNYPIHGAYFDKYWIVEAWTVEGKATLGPEPHVYDLIEVKPRIKRTVWLNVYRDDQTVHDTEVQAIFESSARKDLVDRVKVEIDVEDKS